MWRRSKASELQRLSAPASQPFVQLGASCIMVLRSVGACKHAPEVVVSHTSSIECRRSVGRGSKAALLLLGVSAVAIGAMGGARAQDTQLPTLTVEGSKPKGKKKPVAAKSPPPQAAPAPAPEPVAQPAATAATATQASDVPYTVPAGVSVVGSGEIGTFGQAKLDSVIRTIPHPGGNGKSAFGGDHGASDDSGEGGDDFASGEEAEEEGDEDEDED